jgi:hypothetical protein
MVKFGKTRWTRLAVKGVFCVLFGLGATGFLAAQAGGSSPAGAQGAAPSAAKGAASSDDGGARSIEESFLDEPMQVSVMRELSSSTDRGSKMAALDMISDSIDQGNNGAETVNLLTGLTRDGIQDQTRDGGRIIDNYPDVRSRAAQLLGECSGAKDAAEEVLTKLIETETEPAVQCDALNAMAKLGFDENSMAGELASRTFNEFDAKNPDNRLAMSILNIYEQLAESKSGLRQPRYYLDLVNISQNPNYTYPVRQTAHSLLNQIYGGKTTKTASAGKK